MKKTFFIVAAALFASCAGNQQPQTDSKPAEQVTEVKNDNATDAALDSKVTELVKEFYSKYVFGGEEATDEVINKFCTKKLAKKLADDYEYEGNGYAVWDFRSEGDDVPESKVLDVKPLGSGKYKVIMDHDAICVVTVVVENDKILFDEADNSQSNK